MLTLAVSDLLLIPFTEFLFISVITYFISSCSVWFLLKFDWSFHIVFPCEDFQAFTYLNTPHIIIHNLSLIVTVSEVFLDLFLTSLFLLLCSRYLISRYFNFCLWAAHFSWKLTFQCILWALRGKASFRGDWHLLLPDTNI